MNNVANSSLRDSYEAKKIQLAEKEKEDFSNFYANVLKVESQRRVFKDRNKNSTVSRLE